MTYKNAHNLFWYKIPYFWPLFPILSLRKSTELSKLLPQTPIFFVPGKHFPTFRRRFYHILFKDPVFSRAYAYIKWQIYKPFIFVTPFAWNGTVWSSGGLQFNKFYIKFFHIGQLVHKLNRRHMHMCIQKHVDLIHQSQRSNSEWARETAVEEKYWVLW